MRNVLRVVGPKKGGKTLKEIEESLESNAGFDPEDPPPSLSSFPWDPNLQTDHR